MNTCRKWINSPSPRSTQLCFIFSSAIPTHPMCRYITLHDSTLWTRLLSFDDISKNSWRFWKNLVNEEILHNWNCASSLIDFHNKVFLLVKRFLIKLGVVCLLAHSKVMWILGCYCVERRYTYQSASCYQSGFQGLHSDAFYFVYFHCMAITTTDVCKKLFLPFIPCWWVSTNSPQLFINNIPSLHGKRP